jgi:hypothetical protein
MGIFDAFLTWYHRLCEEPGQFDIGTRFLVGASGAITSTSRQSQHITAVTRLKAGFYAVYLMAKFYVDPSSRSPLLPGPVPRVIGDVTTTDGTVGHIQSDETGGFNTRAITHGTDSLVVATKTFTFSLGAFTFKDVGAKLTVAGTTSGLNDGIYTIVTVTSSTVVVVLEVPGGSDETFGAGVTQAISGYYITISFGRSDTGAAADVLSGNEVDFAISLKTNAP